MIIDINDEITRRYPKVLADKIIEALGFARFLMGDQVDDMLSRYRHNRAANIAVNGLTLGNDQDYVKPLNLKHVPNEWNDALEKLDLAFDMLHKYRKDGAGDYLSKSVKVEAFRKSGGGVKGRRGEARKYLHHLVAKHPEATAKELYKIVCNEAEFEPESFPFQYDSVDKSLWAKGKEITLPQFSTRISKAREK